jgi:hypothetical protein
VFLEVHDFKPKPKNNAKMRYLLGTSVLNKVEPIKEVDRPVNYDVA